MNIDLVFKIVLLIVVIGISCKVIKAITSIGFKIALVVLIVLFFYKMFIGL
ncbi:MAG: hypothetical protein RR942_16545 [Romboutsia sp.]